MARFYSRAEQREYREKRRAQAAIVAERLIGKKRIVWNGEDLVGPNTDDFIDALRYKYMTNIWNSNSRTSFIISGMEGV